MVISVRILVELFIVGDSLKSKFFVIPLVLLFVSFSSGQIKIGCIGNSITNGHYLPLEDAYPINLSNLLGPKINVENYGYAGTTILRNTNHSYWDSPLFAPSLWSFSDIVIILFGTNDSFKDNWVQNGDHFFNDYFEFVYAHKNSTNPKLILCYPPPKFYDSFGDSIIRNEIIPVIDQIASVTQATTVDLYNLLNDKTLFIEDGLHPNKDGMTKIANKLYSVILPLITPSPPSGFKATGGDREITLTWIKHPDPHVSIYHIARSLDVNNIYTYHTGRAQDKTSYTDKNLINGQTYFYKIWVSNDAGHESERSKIASATSGFSGLSTPENFTAIGSNNQVFLNWDDCPEPEVTNYHIIKGEENSGLLDYLIGLNGNTISYADNDVVNEHRYYYSVWASDANGRLSSRSEVKSARPSVFLGVEDIGTSFDLPDKYKLKQNYPNPFNLSTTIYYALPEHTEVRFTIYDMLGRKVRELDIDTKDPGTHSIRWNGLNNIGNPVSAGIYFYQIQAGQFVQTKKMMLLK